LNARPRNRPCFPPPPLSPLVSAAQDKALEEWKPLQLLVEEGGDLGVRAVAALAAAWGQRGERLRLNHLRVLRPLITPKARAEILPLLLPQEGETVSIKALDKEVQRVTHQLWVDFHWSAENPYIDATVRMLSRVPSLSRSVLSCCVVSGVDRSRHGAS
jgi:hypothetical protein